jgi:hypothetical protein
LAAVVLYWRAHGSEPLQNVLPAVAGTALLCIGAQNVLSGFLIAVLGGDGRRGRVSQFEEIGAHDAALEGRRERA